MNRRLPVNILILLLSCFAATKVTLAQTLIPGVAKGDTFYYTMYGHYSSSDPNAVIHVPPFETNNTEWVCIEITGVSDSIIHHVYTLRFVNGTESCIDGQTDLTCSLDFSSGFAGVPICAANLSAGDPLSSVQLTINETLVWSYPSGEREINHVSWNSSEDYGDCYFDKKTGMLVDLYRVHSFVNPNTNEVIKKADIVKMSSSSLWTIQEIAHARIPTFLYPLLFIIGVTLGITVYKIKEKLTKKVS